MSNLLDVPKYRLKRVMRDNINSANLPSRRTRPYAYSPMIKGIIKEFGTPVGPRYRVKNLNVFFQIRERIGPCMAERVMPELGKAYEARCRKSYDWDYGVFDAARWTMLDHDIHMYRTHLVHVSEVDSTQVAFTPDERALIADKQTRMRPGKYLTKYWGSGSLRPLFSEDEIRAMVERLAALNTPKELHLIPNTDPDGWEWVYENSPPSCMRYNRKSRHLHSGLYGMDHPVRLYAHSGNDLALAYIMAEGASAPKDYTFWSEEVEYVVAARAIVNMDLKTYLRIYCSGDTDTTRIMEVTLAKAGFTHSQDTLAGQKLVRRTYDGQIICPYLDGNYLYVEDEGNHLTISRDGLDGQNSDGLIGGVICPCCEETVPDADSLTYCHARDESICHNCLDDYTFAWVSRRSQEWVSDCSYDLYQYNGDYYTSEGLSGHGLSICDHCGEVEDDDNMVYVEGHWVCECHTTTCEVSNETILVEDSTHSDYDGVIADKYRVRLYPCGDYGHEDRVFSLTTSRGVTYVHQEFIKDATEDELRDRFVVIGTELLPASLFGEDGRPPRHGDTYTNVTSGDDCDDNIESYMDATLEEETEELEAA